ncbi:MAG TPA: hypothetical protein DCE42_13500, partial [Myxococcales bacterium]|nr:hypothetical protein [Myxococcales bacterium]
YYTLFSEKDWFRTFRLRLRGESVLPGEKNKLCSYLYYSLTLQAQCERGWSDCGGICRDTEHDPNYCGGCEQKCPRGRECCRGRCRQPVAPSRICGACDDICSIGKACCDGICQSLNENVTHCGACGVRCKSGQRCCGYQCIDVLRNNEHCGLCGKKCQGNRKCCNGECVRLGNDKRHCGACGNTCQASEFCSLGRCQTCEPPNSLCSQTTTPQWPVCVDIRFSNRHCGACANNCATDEVCLNGRCGLCRQSLDCEEDPQCVLGSCKRDFYCSLLGRCKKPSSVNERGHLVLDDVGEVDAFDFQLDPAGRYLLAGSFRGGFTFQQRHLPSQGARDIFVGHYDPKGSSSHRLLWLKQIGGKGDDYGAKIVLTPTQRVSVLGVYGEGGKETTFVDIGNPSATKLTPPTAANNGLFLASFSSAGTLLKVVPLHAGTSHLAPTFDVSKSDEHILAFGVKEADKLKQLGCGTKDLHNKKDPLLARQQLVLMKLTSNLDCDWARIVGTTTAGKMEPVGVGFLKGPDFNEPINVFGNTTGTFQWDTATFSFAGGAHGFLLRASLKGVISPIHTPWSTTVDTWQAAINTGYTVRNGVKDSSNIIAGSFLGTLQAGALSFRSSTKGDVFVAKEAGKIAGSVVQWPHLQSVTVRDIALKWNKSGMNVEGVYVGGEFSGTMVLPNGLSLTSYGKKDIFVMFIDFSSGPGWTTHIGGVGDEWLQRLHVRIASPGIGIHVGGISESEVLYHDGASSKRSLASGARRMFIWNLRL